MTVTSSTIKNFHLWFKLCFCCSVSLLWFTFDCILLLWKLECAINWYNFLNTQSEYYLLLNALTLCEFICWARMNNSYVVRFRHYFLIVKYYVTIIGLVVLTFYQSDKICKIFMTCNVCRDRKVSLRIWLVFGLLSILTFSIYLKFCYPSTSNCSILLFCSSHLEYY